MRKLDSHHWHVEKRFLLRVLPAIPELIYCDIYMKRYHPTGTALAILVPLEAIGAALWVKNGILQSAAKEFGIPAILIYEQMGSRLGAPIDCRIEEVT